MTSPPSERIIVADTGDVIFTLRNPGAPFAAWDQAVEDKSEIQDPEDEHKDEPLNDATSDTRDARSFSGGAMQPPPDTGSRVQMDDLRKLSRVLLDATSTTSLLACPCLVAAAVAAVTVQTT
ncbi:hypothetical protein AA0115_g5275 [Alternaria tenuissima]|uniref:Uncharacterized protein n=1 Tax=Alternaria tenuissima TaxID=119927 RepID=A0AB37WLL9_9PLEO|nr:hypothetical protein AA0115_g5275 [Alternaria tenuissima]